MTIIKIITLLKKLPEKRYRRIIYSMLRKRYLWYFKRDYVLKQIKKRKGSCLGCAGKCCKMTLPWKCEYLSKKGRCRLYNKTKGKKMPFFCKIYPIDEKDLELSGMKGKCQYYW